MEISKSIAVLVLFISMGFAASAQDYTPDLSMDLETFEQEALGHKEDVWVVDFWASWCRPCIQAIPHMKKIHAKYAERGVKFISVSWDRNEAKWMNAVNHYQMPWSHFIVPKGKEAWLEKEFPHKGIPTVFVINRDGKLKKVSDLKKLDKAIYKAL